MRIVLVFLALAGCAASAGPNASADRGSPPAPPAAPVPGPNADAYRASLEAEEAPFHAPGAVTAHLGEQVMVGNLEVKPLEVVEDSRCPIDTECVWAGRLRLRVQLGLSGSSVIELNQPVPVPGGLPLTLIGAMPPNWANPPAGVDPHEPPRFAFRMGRVDR